MRKLYVKIISIILCFLLVVPTFGCGSKKGEEETLKISYWNAGWRDEWLYAIADEYVKRNPDVKIEIDSSVSDGDITNLLPVPDYNPYDIILGCNTETSYYQEYYEPLNDVIQTINDGETKTVGQKIGTELLSSLTFSDGTVRNLFYGAGFYGIIYNQDIFTAHGYQVPKTTNQLISLLDNMRDDNVTPFMNFQSGGYWHAMLWTWAIQYSGYKDFYKLTENPKLDDLIDDENGIKQSLEVLSSILNVKKNIVSGSNAFDYSVAQTQFLAPSSVSGQEVAMMVNGSWLENETKNSEETLVSNIKIMKTPVVSSIIKKCTTITTEAKLLEVIDAIDNGLTSVSGVNETDFKTIKDARAVEVTNSTGLEICIPNYCVNLNIAKDFVAFFYSDVALKIWLEKTGIRSLVNFDDESIQVDVSSLDTFCRSQYDFSNKSFAVTEGQTKSVHEIFTAGNASLVAGYDSPRYITALMGDSAITGTAMWNNIKTNIQSNWEKYWRNCGLNVPD